MKKRYEKPVVRNLSDLGSLSGETDLCAIGDRARTGPCTGGTQYNDCTSGPTVNTGGCAGGTSAQACVNIGSTATFSGTCTDGFGATDSCSNGLGF